MLSELNEIRRYPFANRRLDIKLKHEYVINRPALAAGIPDLHNRAGPVRREKYDTCLV